MAEAKTAVILGVGPLDGLGGRLALTFAERGHHVFIGGRTEDNLNDVVSAVSAAGGRASAVVTDATKESDIASLFAAANADSGRLDLAIYNAGNNMPGRVVEMEADYFEQAWRVCCFGGFIFAQAALRAMLPAGGNLFFTGASASMRGRAGFGAFSSAKGALRNLAQATAKEHGPDGIHVAHVVVDGGIDGEKLRTRRPDRHAALGEAGLISLDGLARSYAFLYDQPAPAWTFELDLRPSIENW